MGIKIIYTGDNRVRMLRDVCALVLGNWEYLASRGDEYIDLTLDSGDDIRINTGYGICNWVKNYLDEDDMQNVYESWDGYSGSFTYPVGGESEYHYSCEDNKYRNPDRRALCEWVRDCCDVAIEHMENEDE